MCSLVENPLSYIDDFMYFYHELNFVLEKCSIHLRSSLGWCLIILVLWLKSLQVSFLVTKDPSFVLACRHM